MTHKEEFKRRVNSFQKSILTVQLFCMVIGISMFTLAVISRPILRITRADYIPTVKWIVNVMAGAGLAQVAVASYDILSACWKLMWPIYLGITGTSVAILLELTAIVSSLYLYTSSDSMVNEDLVHPWYWVECLKISTCHERMVNYIHWFILPQVVLAGVTVILQIVTILLLGRFVRNIVDHHRILHEAQEKYHEEWEERQFNYKQEQSAYPQVKAGPSNFIEASAADGTLAEDHEMVLLRTPTSRRVQFSDTEMSPMGSARKRKGESSDMVHRSTYEAQIHAVVEISTPVTPRSILKEDHGYIAGSRVSLDIDKY